MKREIRYFIKQDDDKMLQDLIGRAGGDQTSWISAGLKKCFAELRDTGEVKIPAIQKPEEVKATA